MLPLSVLFHATNTLPQGLSVARVCEMEMKARQLNNRRSKTKSYSPACLRTVQIESKTRRGNCEEPRLEIPPPPALLSTRTLTPLKAPHPTPGLLKQVSKFISLLPNFLQFTCMFLLHSPRHHFSLTEELPREPTARSAAGSTLQAPQPAASLSLGLEHFRPPSRLYSFI